MLCSRRQDASSSDRKYFRDYIHRQNGSILSANYPSKARAEFRPSRIVPPTSCRECPIRATALYGRLSGDEIERRRGDCRLVRARRTILREGERLQEVYTIFEGWAFSYKLLVDGRRQILSFLLPGEFIALPLLRMDSVTFSVQALTDVLLCSFPMKNMRELFAQENGLSAEAQARCLAYTAGLEDRLTDLGRRNAEERLARLLLDLHGRLQQLDALNDDGSCPFPLRQEHVADALGLTPVHVSRVMALLKAEKLISTQSGSLTLLDVPRLRALVERGRS